MPTDFKNYDFIVREIDSNSPIFYNAIESGGCSNIKYEEYLFSPGNTPDSKNNNYIKTLPISNWVCLSSDTAYSNGYDRSMNERIVYSKSESLWIKVNNKKLDIIPSGFNRVYKSLRLYNIKSKNAKGYVVFDKNLTKDDKNTYKNADELISFCLVQDSTYSALCGSGSITSTSGEIPYILKSIESMEIGLGNKLNEKPSTGTARLLTK